MGKKHEKKERKREKKEKKREKKEKKRKLKELQKQAKRMLRETEPPRVSPPSLQLSVEDNYYSHNKEFRFWLKQTNQTSWDDLANDAARSLFATFTDAWNEGKLPNRYYSGDLQSASNSSWVTGGNTTKDLQNKFNSEELFNRNDRPKTEKNEEVPKRPDRYEEEQRWEKLRMERKRFHKHNSFVEEELVPTNVDLQRRI